MKGRVAPVEEAEPARAPAGRPPAAEPGKLSQRRTIGTRVRERITPRALIVGAGNIGVLALLILAWQVFAGRPGEGLAIVDEFYVGRPGEAWAAFVGWVEDGTLLTNTIITLRETLYGFAIGCSLGVVAGFALGLSNILGDILRPLVMAANTIPKLALAPMLIMWFGIGEASKVAVAALLVFFLVFNNTYQGVREVDQHLVNALKMLGASRMLILRRVTIPSSLVWVVTSMRISVPYAFLGAVVGEMMAAQDGLGTLIQKSSNAFQPSAMVAAILVLIVMALILNAVISVLERVLLRWRYV
ncbi:ABC transporter permease [Streptosporangium sp. NPDC006930]|uniref:ABC transporter permease n=1 Tax=unclassified Streptosporangium TaxID=2632669 RepID=UPI003419CB13